MHTAKNCKCKWDYHEVLFSEEKPYFDRWRERGTGDAQHDADKASEEEQNVHGVGTANAHSIDDE